MKYRHGLLCLALSGAIVACDSGSAEKPAGEKPPAPSAAAKEKPEAETKPAALPAAVEMVEHDLGAADAEWKGWIAKGPKDAKVLQDGVKGARIAANGADGFDLSFAPTKRDLAELKKNLEKGAEASKGEMKLEFVKEEDGLLEWIAEGYGAKKYNFVLHMKVADRDVTCANNYMIGIGSEEALKQHKDACKTLAKK